MHWPPLVQARSRIKLLAAFLIALLCVKSINFAEIAQTVVVLMAIPQQWVLSIGRIEWKFGDCVFHILMLGIVDEGVAFPIA